MPWLFILFVVLPALELYLLIELGQLIGATNTFLLILGTGILGSYMAKSQGLAAWRRLNEKLSKGGIPGKELVDGAIILVSGTLLITPGVLTDIIGFLGLFPLTRNAIRSVAAKLFKTVVPLAGQMNFYSGSPSTATPEEASAEEDYATWSGSAKERPTYDSN
ncbi:MAG: FxsA family protein [Rhodothermales bacterium]|nr:FxsA family protein [Rhodothermales bacterium]MDG2017622.1 FxsA family protein [Rhodothermales bacterium]HAY36361.1 hypothetical protein [Bacteroidota bacterium]